ncbi:MAG: SPFH domain-containing protein [Chloroflexota bacterium]
MWKFFTAGLGLGISVIAGISFGWMLVGAIILLGTAGVGSFLYFRAASITLGEFQAALVIDSRTGNFVRFLMPGSHLTDPFREEISKVIPLNSQTAKHTSEGIQTSGGIPVKVSWQVGYSIQPNKIGREYMSKMARAFSGKVDGTIQKRANAALQHVVGEMPPQELTAPGAVKRLERHVKQICKAKFDQKGIKINEVLVDHIQLPRHVRESLESAHERELLAEQEARILERLHKVVSQFSTEEMDRLIELERIQMLGRNGVTMMMPSAGQLIGHQPVSDRFLNRSPKRAN